MLLIIIQKTIISVDGLSINILLWRPRLALYFGIQQIPLFFCCVAMRGDSCVGLYLGIGSILLCVILSSQQLKKTLDIIVLLLFPGRLADNTTVDDDGCYDACWG